MPFVETSVSSVWSQFGLRPADSHDFSTRLMVQEEILKALDATYAKYAGVQFVADRTPLDLIAYTLADATGDAVAPENQLRLDGYVQRCFESANKRFGALVIVQPGIPLIYEEGKAAMNKAYIEHLNYLMLGLQNDQRLMAKHFCIPRATTNLAKRMDALDYCLRRVRDMTAVQLMEEVGRQATLH